MSKKPPSSTKDPVEEEQRRVKAKDNGSETLASGGMSPIIDRKDPSDWAKSAAAGPATGADTEKAKGAGAGKPAEPVGGWVNASTGRGKILVPKKDAAKRAEHGAEEEATVSLGDDEMEKEPKGASKSPETLSGRVRSKRNADEAAADEVEDSTYAAERAPAASGAEDDEDDDEDEQDEEAEDEPK